MSEPVTDRETIGTGVDHATRRDRLRGRLDGTGVDALWVTDLTNVRWLTGFTGSNGQMFVARDADRDLFCTDGRYQDQARSQVPGLEHEIVRSGAHEAALARLAAGDRVGFEADHLDYRTAHQVIDAARQAGLEAVAVTGLVEGLRTIKDPGEIAALREACRVTDAAFETLLEVLQPGVSERDVALQLERAMVDLGAEACAFDSIVAFGEASAEPHHRPTGRTLRRGDLVKVDYGARYAGYHADMSRTVAVGEPDDELRAVHDLVRRAQAAGVDAAVAGAAVADVDAVCRDLIGDAGYRDRFLHSTGHGVGLEIHEEPRLGEKTAATLAAGMTVTVEPGVYLAGRGGVRIEDTIAITSSGPPEVLTTSPRDLIVL